MSVSGLRSGKLPVAPNDARCRECHLLHILTASTRRTLKSSHRLHYPHYPFCRNNRWRLPMFGTGAMTRTDGRGGPVLDGVETAVAAARVSVSSATRSAFDRGLAQTSPPPPPDFRRSASPKSSSGNVSPFSPTRSARLMPWRAGSDAMSRLILRRFAPPARPLRPPPGRRPLLSDSLFTEVQPS